MCVSSHKHETMLQLHWNKGDLTAEHHGLMAWCLSDSSKWSWNPPRIGLNSLGDCIVCLPKKHMETPREIQVPHPSEAGVSTCDAFVLSTVGAPDATPDGPWGITSEEVAGIFPIYPAWWCQNSYWKWPLIVSFPMKNADFPVRYVNVYQRVP